MPIMGLKLSGYMITLETAAIIINSDAMIREEVLCLVIILIFAQK